MRRRAESPPGQSKHESPHPPKRPRRSVSPSATSPTDSTVSRIMRTVTSPIHRRRPSSISSPNPRSNPPNLPTIPQGTHAPPSLPSAGPSTLATPTGPAGPGPLGPSTYQSFSSVGPSSHPQHPPKTSEWTSNWPPPRKVGRRSTNVKSPSPSSSTELGGENSGTGQPDIVFTRDMSNRQPRSMMACMRCRRQKMKCDGPGKEPCRGCRQAGVPCIFESRTRPKSIAVIPSHGSPFYSGTHPSRVGTPGPSFYPASSQPAPPITSRPSLVTDYRHVREPMPPPTTITSMAAIAPPSSPYSMLPRSHSPMAPSGQQQPAYYPIHSHGQPPPPSLPHVHQHTPTQSMSGSIAPYPAQPPSQSVPPSLARPPTPQSVTQQPTIDSRIRILESGFRSVSTLPAAVAGIQSMLGNILRSQDSIREQLASGSSGVARSVGQPRSVPVVTTDLPDHVWESYRRRAWPLTPWLPGISQLPGLPTLVLVFLGRRSVIDRTDVGRRESEEAASAVVDEIGRLLGRRIPWTKDEVLSLGAFATWSNDAALACLAVGLARDLAFDRIWRKTHDEWREWIYVVLADRMHHLPDFNTPIVLEPIAGYWRDRIEGWTPPDPATRDRDSKLLAWLEYSEILSQVHQRQCNFYIHEGGSDSHNSSPDRSETGRSISCSGTGAPVSDSRLTRESPRRRALEVWHQYGDKLENWANLFSARYDPVLSLHLSYAVLFVASPVFAASSSVWPGLAQSREGYRQLERARDAAFSLLQTLCSPDISSTLTFSFPIYRPFFGLAIAHLVSLATTMPNSSIISLNHVQSVLRNVFETLLAVQPLDMASASFPPLTAGSGTTPSATGSVQSPLPVPGQLRSGSLRPSSSGTISGLGATAVPPLSRRQELSPSLLYEMVETGNVSVVGRRDIVGAEPGRELWRRLMG